MSVLYIRIDIRHLCLVSIAKLLRNFAMADFEENVEEMVGTTREEKRQVATESQRSRDETGDKTAATAGDK